MSHDKEKINVAVATRHRAKTTASVTNLSEQNTFGRELEDLGSRELADEVINDAGREQAWPQQPPPPIVAQVFGLWGAFIRSGMVLGGDAVLVDEAAEPVVPADRAGGRRRDRLCWLAGLGRSGAERAVRPMPVLVVDELVQDMP
jgi:hypothetical protein